MCTVTVAQEILDCLRVKVSQGEIFTAFDVTQAARVATSETVLHRDVRNIVGNEFVSGAMGDYQRQLVELDAKDNPQALVYFPDGTDPYDHPMAVRPVAPDPADDEVLEDTVGTDSTNPDVFTVTAEGRVNVPLKLLSKVDDTGGTIDVVVNGTLHCQKPNADGRVRLSGFTVKKVRILADAKQITIDNA